MKYQVNHRMSWTEASRLLIEIAAKSLTGAHKGLRATPPHSAGAQQVCEHLVRAKLILRYKTFEEVYILKQYAIEDATIPTWTHFQIREPWFEIIRQIWIEPIYYWFITQVKFATQKLIQYTQWLCNNWFCWL